MSFQMTSIRLHEADTFDSSNSDRTVRAPKVGMVEKRERTNRLRHGRSCWTSTAVLTAVARSDLGDRLSDDVECGVLIRT